MKFIEFLAQHDHLMGAMLLISLIAFIFSLRYHGRHRALRIIPYYFASWLLMGGVEFYLYISPGDHFALVLDETTGGILTVFEFCVFSLLILYCVEGAGRRLAIKLNTAIFFITEIFLFFRTFPGQQTIPMGLLEATGLVLPCVIYFYELFTNTNTKALKDRPSFWLVIGITCETALNSSLILSMEYLGRFAEGAYAFAVLFYGILFALIVRAYKYSLEVRGV